MKTYEIVIAEDLAIGRLRQQQVMSRIKISDHDVENFLNSPEGQAALGTQVHVIHMRISGDNSEEVQKVAQEVKQCAYELVMIQKRLALNYQHLL